MITCHLKGSCYFGIGPVTKALQIQSFMGEATSPLELCNSILLYMTSAKGNTLVKMCSCFPFCSFSMVSFGPALSHKSTS